MKHTDGFGSEHHHWHPGEDRAFLDRAIQRLNETPPAPGLTTTPTNAIHDVYSTDEITWYITPAEQKRIARRAKQVDDTPAVDAAIATVKATKVRGWNTGTKRGAA